MSFELHFSPLRYDGTFSEGINPFTNERMRSARTADLTRAEAKAVHALLDAAGKPDATGCLIVEARDGGRAEVFGRVEQGCMLTLRRLTPGLVELMFELLRAARWGIGLDDGNVVARPIDVTHLPDSELPLRTVTSATELAEVLAPGFAAWASYRDKALGTGTKPKPKPKKAAPANAPARKPKR